LAGPNGSGKSTATKGIRQVLQLDNWIDPDVVAQQILAQYGETIGELQASQIAFETARNMRIEYARGLQSFGFETVFSHISNAEFLDALKTLGYVVHLYFVCTDDPQINIGRVRNRHSLGGHDVPEDRIVDRYYRALGHLSQCTRRFDRIVLIDNSAAQTPGQAIGEIRNEGEISIELFPRPHLPDWVLSAALTQAFERTMLGPDMLYTNSYYDNNPTGRNDLLNQFLL